MPRDGLGGKEGDIDEDARSDRLSRQGVAVCWAIALWAKELNAIMADKQECWTGNGNGLVECASVCWETFRI